jgi:hypothetical protein
MSKMPIIPVLCWFWYPETWTSFVDWAQLSRLLPEDGYKRPVSETFLSESRTINNV